MAGNHTNYSETSGATPPRKTYTVRIDSRTRTCMHSLDQLATEICTLAGHINAANHRFLVLIAEYDRRNGWSDGATQSCAHWLNWSCAGATSLSRYSTCAPPRVRWRGRRCRHIA